MEGLKRPLAVVGFSMLLTVLCIILVDSTALAVFAVVLAGICLVAGVSVLLRFRPADTLIAIGVGIAVGALLFLNADYSRREALIFCGEDRYVEAVISSKAKFSDGNDRFYVEAKVKTIDGEKVDGKIRLSFPGEVGGVHNELKTGDRIKFTAVIYKIGSDSEDIHNSFSADKIYLGGYSVNVLSISAPTVRPLTYYAELLRDKIRNNLSEGYSEDVAGLINSMLTGDKSNCPDDVYLSFKRSGAAHIMAVSGLHLSIWLSALFLVWKSGEKMRKLKFMAGMIFIAFFVFLADFSPSVCRAALMSSLYLFGTLLKKNAEPLNTLGFALVCILCVNPFTVFSVSFQLSFACVLSIIVVAAPLCDASNVKLKKLIKNKYMCRVALYALNCIIISLSVSVATFPISSYSFGYVSLVSPLTNLFIVPACAPLMICSVLSLSGIPYISDLFRIVTDVLSKYMLFIADGFSSLTFAAVCTDMREKLLWFVGAFALFLLYLLKRTNRKRLLKTASVLTVILAIFSLLAIVEKRTDECKIKMINTEDGSSAVLIYNGKGILLGVSDDYYFYGMLEGIVEAENIDIVAAVPLRESDAKELMYVCGDFDIEHMVNEGETVTLFGDTSVKLNGYGVEISAKGKRISVFSSDCLQLEESYDIIIRNDGAIILADGEEVISYKKGHSATVYISEGKDIKVRREELWPNLMKKS